MLSLNKIFYKALFGRTRDQREKNFSTIEWKFKHCMKFSSKEGKSSNIEWQFSFFFPNKGKVIEKCMSIISPMVNKKLILMYKKSSC